MAVKDELRVSRKRRAQLRREVEDLLEQIAALVRSRAFLRRAGIDARGLDE